ncbi:pimeloyl-ACP methyl ester carboxylesterase [Microbacterium natoriense]|uniref:Pimeloyl-ACP methyl ester carboxylesterase n=1 Tax=Microbacterium natoriense TaxID=284570 RepID=A0AAW8EXP3_9MICO|nr:alpha/beta hydrolase [Microbacterium natoriense]MDQ0648037.1 pimeloyl-ACP methyl ester carboxylesterase [Microbacterium natoriense]
MIPDEAVETVDLPETRTLAVADGREITWCEFGDPRGVPVLAAHGSPGSRYQLLPLDEAARAAGVRLIAPDRPGFGGTSPNPPNGFHTWDADAVALLDALGLKAVTVLGFSGGAGYALALASSAQTRVSRLVIVCGMIPGAPRSVLIGRIPIISVLYRVSRWLPALATAMLEGRGPFRNTREANLAAWPAADRVVMADPRTKMLMAADAAASTAQGARAGIDDLRRYHRPLPEGLESIRQPVRLLHGAADGNVPIGVARWAVSRLPSASLQEIPAGGHYFAVISADLVVEALLAAP